MAPYRLPERSAAFAAAESVRDGALLPWRGVEDRLNMEPRVEIDRQIRRPRLGPRLVIRAGVHFSGLPVGGDGPESRRPRAGRAAKFPFLIHSHMLRHSTGYKLANDGQDTRSIQAYLGHRSIVSTQRYTALAPDRFKRFWKD